jgi:hypothetical protein
MVLAVIFTVLTAAPAGAVVECRHQMKACRHCLKPQRDAAPQVKGECCVVKAPQAKEPARSDLQGSPHFELTLAVDQSLLFQEGNSSSLAYPGSLKGPAPPLPQRSTPLLH